MSTLRVCAIGFVLLAGAASAQTVYTARLGPVAYDGAQRANVQGDGKVTARLEGRTLSVSGDFSGLPSIVTVVELRAGPGIGVPGASLAALEKTGVRDGTMSGTITLSAVQLAALRKGHVYLQIDSDKAPDGNLWGWLLPQHDFAGADVPEKGHGFLPQLDIPGNWDEKK
jgi:hypothetical protein